MNRAENAQPLRRQPLLQQERLRPALIGRGKAPQEFDQPMPRQLRDAGRDGWLPFGPGGLDCFNTSHRDATVLQTTTTFNDKLFTT